MMFLVLKAMHFVSWALIVGGHVAFMVLAPGVRRKQIDLHLLEMIPHRVILPGVAMALLTGIGLASILPGFTHQGWFQVKMALILALMISGRVLGRLTKTLGPDAATPGPAFDGVCWGMLVTVASVIMLAVIKPF